MPCCSTRPLPSRGSSRVDARARRLPVDQRQRVIGVIVDRDRRPAETVGDDEPRADEDGDRKQEPDDQPQRRRPLDGGDHRTSGHEAAGGVGAWTSTLGTGLLLLVLLLVTLPPPPLPPRTKNQIPTSSRMTSTMPAITPLLDPRSVTTTVSRSVMGGQSFRAPRSRGWT